MRKPRQLQALVEPILEQRGLPSLSTAAPCGGGSINDAWRGELKDGSAVFVKYHERAPAGFFAAEVDGLRALAEAGALRVPEVLGHDDRVLVLEFIPAGLRAHDFWEQLAEGLAKLHRQPQPCFGFRRDNFCGLTPQPNPRESDGLHFFARHRLQYQAALATRQGLLSRGDGEAVDRLCERLPELLPDEPPVLLHGDLWLGNLHCDQHGAPVLIDPACYWGWRETDLAMANLFGRLPPAFYDTYQDHWPLQTGWRQRMPIFNLYHLLNHLNLFGKGYLGEVREVLARFAPH